MSATFASQEWADSLAVHLTDDARVRTESVTWVFGPIVLLVDADAEHGLDAAAIRIDLHEGSVRGVTVAAPDAALAPFAIEGALARWKSVFGGSLDILDGILKAQLRSRGDLPTLNRHRGLFAAIAQAGAAIETTWQDEEAAAPATPI